MLSVNILNEDLGAWHSPHISKEILFYKKLWEPFEDIQKRPYMIKEKLLIF